MTALDKIMNYASNHESVTADALATEYGMNTVTARQHLCRLAADGTLARIGFGRYSLKTDDKETYPLNPSNKILRIHRNLCSDLPFADFCIYSGDVFEPLQHHLSTNHAIYVEVNRDSIDSVFYLLKEKYSKVYKQPTSDFIRDYVNLREESIIVKPLVTEAPVKIIDNVPCPTIEKILVDIAKDADLNYLQGMEYQYMFDTAIGHYKISLPKMFRYARRRGAEKIINPLLRR